jgi:hypothetical protein
VIAGTETVFKQAGSRVGLPVLFLLASMLCASGSQELIFDEIHSSCIDLARYDTNKHELTVRFAQRREFYSYRQVPLEVWSRLKQLNVKGSGVGTYFVETVVNHPETFPYVQLESPKFRVKPPKQKAGDSK